MVLHDGMVPVVVEPQVLVLREVSKPIQAGLRKVIADWMSVLQGVESQAWKQDRIGQPIWQICPGLCVNWHVGEPWSPWSTQGLEGEWSEIWIEKGTAIAWALAAAPPGRPESELFSTIERKVPGLAHKAEPQTPLHPSVEFECPIQYHKSNKKLPKVRCGTWTRRG